MTARYALNEEVYTEELGWYSYNSLVQRVVELEATQDADATDGPTAPSADLLYPPVRDDYEMYTDDANRAVAVALGRINLLAVGADNRASLAALAKPVLQALGARHGETWDTEPRGHINDHLDAICKARGWAYDPNDYYDW